MGLFLSEGGRPLLSQIVVYLVVATIAGFATQRFWIWYRLRHIPGPFLGSVSMMWMMRNTLNGRMHLELKNVCDTYGESHSEKTCVQAHELIGPEDLWYELGQIN